MGESLFSQFIDEEVEDINKILALYGVVGILEQFEIWLQRNGHLKE